MYIICNTKYLSHFKKKKKKYVLGIEDSKGKGDNLY